MNVSAWSIRNPIAVSLLFILLTFSGLLAWHGLKIQQFPDIDLPVVSIQASWPSASPSQLETEVAQKIENAVATLQQVKHIHSLLQDGTATITIEFLIEKPIDEAVNEVRDAVSRIRADLPADLRDPAISKRNIAGSPVLAYTVASERLDDEALSWFVDHTISKQLLAISGVGAVARVGGVQREVRIELDPTRLLALGATVSDISRQLRQIQTQASGGRADVGGAEQSVRTVALASTAPELAQLDLTLSDGRPIRLADVATVRDTIAEPRAMALLDGQPVVAFEVSRARGASEVEVAQRVRQALDELQATHSDIHITEAFNFVDPVIENYRGSMTLLLEGAILAVLVVWFFLRDGRATLISAAALPLSAIPTFAAMSLMGFTLNMVTLLSFSLVIGILVDDAIVEIENIVRHMRMGKTPYQAAMEAADEIGLAVIATTFTLIAVFLPTAFMGGVPGKFFVQFGWTAAIAVFFSLVVARMLTPMMAAYLLTTPRAAHTSPRWLSVLMRAVKWCLHHRFSTLLAALCFFVGAIALATHLPTGFIPADDVSQTQVTLSLPPGSTLEQSLEAAEQARRIVQQHPHVKWVYTTIGAGAAGTDPMATAGAPLARKATLTLKLTDRKARAGIRKQVIEQALRESLSVLPGVRITLGLGNSAEKYMLVLAGENNEQLATHALKVERELRSLPGIGSVSSSASLVRPELVVRPDFARAADLGVTASAIADTLRVATAGDYTQNLAKMNFSQRQVPIVVRLPADARKDLRLLERLPVPGHRRPVMLGTVASLALESGPEEISRYDRQRNVRFEVESGQQPLGHIEAMASQLPSLRNLPTGVSQAAIGDAEAMNELFASFGLALLTGVLCIYFVLVLLFKDFVQPITILAALVLSVPGAILALFIANFALSMPAMIGLFMLMGVAAKNSILLVDYVVIARRQKALGRLDALLDACHKRARPIIMTTVAMAAGMTPIALGWGNDPSFRAPMAIVVIGGLITSTFLSLLVIPVVYTYVDDAIVGTQRLAQRLRKATAINPRFDGSASAPRRPPPQ